MFSKKLFDKLKDDHPEWARRVYCNGVVNRIRKPKEDGGMELDVNTEVGILREEVARLTAIIQILHPEYQPSEKFTSYNDGVNGRKAETREEMGIE